MSSLMAVDLGYNVFSEVGFWNWQILYSSFRSMNIILDSIYKIFLFFIGASDAETNQMLTGSPSGNILTDLFTNRGARSIALWFAVFTALGVLIFAISIIISIVRTEYVSKDNKEGKVKIFKSSLKGVLLVILLPVIFGVALSVISTIMNGVIGVMSSSGGEQKSLPQLLFEACLPAGADFSKYDWQMTYQEFESVYNGSTQDFHSIIGMIAGFVLLFILITTILTLIERIIDLVFLYIISPIVIAVSPLDEGNRLGIWKDLVVSKFLSVVGIIICFYIYLLFMNVINQLFATNHSFLVSIVKLLCAVGGLLATKKGSLLISNLVGHNTALIEGQQQGLSAQMVGTGFHAGMQAIGRLASTSAGLLKNGVTRVAGGVMTGGITTAVGAATDVVKGAANTAKNTFNAAAAAYRQQSGMNNAGGGAGAANQSLNNSSNTNIAAPVVGAAKQTIQGIASAGQKMGQAAAGGNGIPGAGIIGAAAQTAQTVVNTGMRMAQPPSQNAGSVPDSAAPISEQAAKTMPPPSSNIQGVINSANSFKSGSGNEGKK